jgi:integrase
MSARKYLTERTLNALKPAAPGTRYELYDTKLPGFGVRVSDDINNKKAGRIAFILYARFGGSRSPGRRGLGFYCGGAPGLTLGEAREKANAWLTLIKQGKDPAVVEEHKATEEKRQEQLKQQHGFAAVAEQFIALKVSKERNAKATAREIKVFVDAWGAKPITEITRRDVRDVIEPRAADAPYMARNLLGTIKRLFVWAIRSERYGLEASPCGSLLPSDLDIADKQARDRDLDDDEIRAFWRATQRMSYPAQQVYQLLALLGLRKSEVAKAQWSEFHPELRRLLQQGEHPISWQTIKPRWKIWVIPARRMKGKNGKARDHAVPLSEAALQVLETLPLVDDIYLFSARRGRPMVAYHKSKIQLDALTTKELRDMARHRGGNPDAVQLKEWRIHDLRRTVRSGLSQLRVPRDVSEAVLAHVPPGIVGVYDTYDYLEEKAKALELWSAHLISIVEPKPAPDNVTVLRRA